MGFIRLIVALLSPIALLSAQQAPPVAPTPQPTQAVVPGPTIFVGTFEGTLGNRVTTILREQLAKNPAWKLDYTAYANYLLSGKVVYPQVDSEDLDIAQRAAREQRAVEAAATEKGRVAQIIVHQPKRKPGANNPKSNPSPPTTNVPEKIGLALHIVALDRGYSQDTYVIGTASGLEMAILNLCQKLVAALDAFRVTGILGSARSQGSQATPRPINFAPSAVAARIADVDGRAITINRGFSDGIREGTRFKVYHPLKEIQDPVTGEVLEFRVGPLLGEVVITSVRERVSSGTFTGTSVPQMKDIAVP